MTCNVRLSLFSGTTTWISGRETGETKLTLTVRSGDDSRHKITAVLTRVGILSRGRGIVDGSHCTTHVGNLLVVAEGVGATASPLA